MSTVSQKKAEEYREKAENFKKLKRMLMVTVIGDLVLAILWAFIWVKKSSGMGFAQAYKNEPLYFWLCIMFVVFAILSWLCIPLMRRLSFRDVDNEDMVE